MSNVIESPTRRRVYVDCRPIFSGDNAQVRKKMKIKQLIRASKGPLAPILKDMGEAKVVAIAQDLLENRVFASEPRAKVEFPTLFRSSPLREAQRQESELDAARSTAGALDEIASQEGEQAGSDDDEEEGGALGDIASLLEEADPGVGASGTTDVPVEEHVARDKLPSLYPSYLPYHAQHLILTKAQQVLEECCFDYATVSMQSVLRDKKWDCPAAVELTQWTKILRKRKHFRRESLALEVGGAKGGDILTKVSNLRHTAVHRLPTTARGVSQLLEASVRFAQVLQDGLRAAQLEELLSDLNSQIKALELYKNVLEDTASRKLEDIQRRRDELDRMERELIEGMLKDDVDQKVLIGQLLEDSVRDIFSSGKQADKRKENEDEEEQNDEDDDEEEENEKAVDDVGTNQVDGEASAVL